MGTATRITGKVAKTTGVSMYKAFSKTGKVIKKRAKNTYDNYQRKRHSRKKIE